MSEQPKFGRTHRKEKHLDSSTSAQFNFRDSKSQNQSRKMKNQKSYGSTRTQHKYSKIKSIDIKDVKRIKSKFSNDKNRNIIFTLLKNSDLKLERSKKESYKESRR